MARPEKTAVVDQVKSDLDDTAATVLTEYRGLSVAEMAELRTKLREQGGTYKVAKNTLVRIAAKESGLDIPDEVLTGPTALAYTGDNIAGVAKALKNFAKDHPQLLIKGAVLEGNFMGAEDATKLADLESREDLLASMVGFFEAMLGYAPHMLDDLLTETVGLMTALEDKKDA